MSYCTTMRQLLRSIAGELTTKSTNATKGDEQAYEDSFVLFVSFVVKLIFRCGRRPGCDFCGENLKNGRDDRPADICERVIK